MKSIYKEIKGKKNTLFVVIFFVAIIIVASMFYNFLVPSTGKPIYGNRLDGIENVNITEEQETDLDSIIEKNSNIVNSEVNLSGKTLNIVIYFNGSTESNDAKSFVTFLLEPFSKEQLAYYDIQVSIENENEEVAGYPIIAYKNRSEEDFAFSQAN